MAAKTDGEAFAADAPPTGGDEKAPRSLVRGSILFIDATRSGLRRRTRDIASVQLHPVRSILSDVLLDGERSNTPGDVTA